MAEIKQVLMPDIGDSKDVPVIEVMVKAGDTVKAEQSLLTLETDKATMDVPAPFDGVVKNVSVKVGDKVSEGTLILLMETSATETSADVSPTTTPAPVKEAANPAASNACYSACSYAHCRANWFAKQPYRQGACQPVHSAFCARTGG